MLDTILQPLIDLITPAIITFVVAFLKDGIMKFIPAAGLPWLLGIGGAVVSLVANRFGIDLTIGDAANVSDLMAMISGLFTGLLAVAYHEAAKLLGKLFAKK
jgi:hypothetical protein